MWASVWCFAEAMGVTPDPGSAIADRRHPRSPSMLQPDLFAS